jgi:hypothetical protein
MLEGVLTQWQPYGGPELQPERQPDGLAQRASDRSVLVAPDGLTHCRAYDASGFTRRL